jgi:superfamily II DNA helicase RecQ
VKAGIPCGCLLASTTQGKTYQEKVVRKIAIGLTRVLFVTPEKFQKNAGFRNFLRKMHEQRGIQFVIDEAHCVIEYANFR